MRKILKKFLTFTRSKLFFRLLFILAVSLAGYYFSNSIFSGQSTVTLTIKLNPDNLAKIQKTIPPAAPEIKRKLKKFTQVQYIMGTLFRIELYSESKQAADKALSRAFQEIRKHDLIMSNYRPDSELSRVLTIAHLYPVVISPELFEIFSISLNFSELTGGNFDVSVGPLVRLWGFKNKNFKKPQATIIAKLKEKVGYRNIYLNPYTRTLFLRKKGMEIDFGGIGKGYAIDKAVTILREEGIISGLIYAVSNQYYIGSPPGSPYWNVGIKHPRNPNEIIKYLKLKDQSVSTSGDYEQFFIENGIRYSHIIDPKTGYPIKHKVAACTVILNNSADADALSTALLLLDGKELESIIEKFKNIYVVKITNQGNKLQTSTFNN